MESTASQVGLLLVNAVAGFFLFIVVLRFLLQAVKADFYNPISQFVIKATNPLLIPIRKIVPGFGGFDVAALVLLVAIELAAIVLSLLMLNYTQLPVSNILIWAVLGSVGLFLKLYFWGILIMIIASWIAPQSQNPALLLIRQLVEPVMKPIRKMLPDMGGLDISPIVVFLGIQVLEVILIGMARGSGAPGFIIGL